MSISTPVIVDLVLRPATLDDAAFAADMYTGLQPDDPEDPALWRHWWATADPSSTVRRYIATRDGTAVGLAGMQHPSWDKMPERYARVMGEVVRELRTPERVGALLAFSEELAKRDGAVRGTSWAWEWDTLRIGVLSARGYREERRERFWELDLAANRTRLEEMTRASRESMRRQGIRVLTVADDPDPDKHRKIWSMSEEASQDTPRTVPWVPTPFEVFRTWLDDPGIREDRMWIARVGDDVVGISVLSYPPERGVVSTDWTGTARSVRGKGVARALKCETVTQAIALGVDRVRTDNDSQNKPILHINESMGYEPRPEMIQFIKELGPS
jgi:RimJ/RimL family protein N-acetyltransferase